MLGQLESNVEHAQAVESHPASAVSLLKDASRGQRLRAVEQTNVVEAQKATFEDVFALGVLAIHPPGEVQQKLLKNSLKEINILTSV
jgi:hypothetical protein